MDLLFLLRFVEPESKDLACLKGALLCHIDGSFQKEGGEIGWGK